MVKAGIQTKWPSECIEVKNWNGGPLNMGFDFQLPPAETESSTVGTTKAVLIKSVNTPKNNCGSLIKYSSLIIEIVIYLFCFVVI